MRDLSSCVLARNLYQMFLPENRHLIRDRRSLNPTSNPNLKKNKRRNNEPSHWNWTYTSSDEKVPFNMSRDSCRKISSDSETRFNSAQAKIKHNSHKYGEFDFLKKTKFTCTSSSDPCTCWCLQCFQTIKVVNKQQHIHTHTQAKNSESEEALAGRGWT